MILATAVFYINEIRTALLIVFDAGMVYRMIRILTEQMDLEEWDQSAKKSLKNHAKATVIVNLSYALVSIYVKYYK